MNHLSTLIIPLIVICIIIYKQSKIDTLHDVVEYTKFTDKLLNILFFMALCVIITLGILIALEGEINKMAFLKDLLFDVFITILTSGLITAFTYYKILKNLPDRIEKQINDIMDIKILHVNGHTDTSNNALRDGHTNLTKEHDRLTKEHDRITKEHDRITDEHNSITGKIQLLLDDMNRRQGSGVSDKTALHYASLMQETTIRLVEQIESSSKTVVDLENKLKDLEINQSKLLEENKLLKEKNIELNSELKKQAAYSNDTNKKDKIVVDQGNSFNIDNDSSFHL